MKMRIAKRWAAICGGFILSGIFLWIALRQVDRNTLLISFSTVKFIPLMLCAVLLSLGIILRAVRWRVIAGFSPENQHGFSKATNLGVLANLIFPGRAGEFVRVITLAKLLQASLAGPLASAVIDRLVDIFVLLAGAFFLYWLLPISDLVGKWLTVFAIAGLSIVLLIVVYANSKGFGEVLIARLIKRWLQRWPLQPEIFMAEVRVEFRRLLGVGLSLGLMMIAISILCVDYSAIYALLRAFDLSLPAEASLTLWVFLAAGSALPSAPGYIGIYQVAAVWSLSLFSVAASTSVAVATTLQVVTLAVALIMVGATHLNFFAKFRYNKFWC